MGYIALSVVATPTQFPEGDVLKYRLISGSFLVALVLLSVFWEAPAATVIFVCFGCFCVGAALTEFLGMAAAAGYPGYRPVLVLGGLLYVLAVAGEAKGMVTQGLPMFVLAILIVALFLAAFREPDLRQALMNVIVSLGGFLYLAWTLAFLVRIYCFEPGTRAGPFLVLFVILVTKFNDIGGYTVGNLSNRLIGNNHKMTPRLSPKKSWEGLVGSVVFSVGIACLLLHWFGDRMQPHDQPLITMPIAVCIGVAAAILGVWGDLAESVIKRGAGVKDSGTMVPGVGGLLDVLDSLVFVAPLFYWYIAFSKAQSIFTPVAEQLTN